MNRPLRRVALGMLVLIGLLMATFSYHQVVAADSLNDHRSNSRVQIREYATERGAILVGGKPIAESVETDDRLKYLRRYSAPQTYAHVTGFDSLVYGASQIEKAEDDFLGGEDARLKIRRPLSWLSGENVRGGNLELTLNPAAQRAAVKGLRGKKGAVVAIDPTTGAILAMASSPTYDPNLLSSHNPASIRAAWERLQEDKDNPALNRASNELYPPGSTFKLVTLAAALTSGKYDRDSVVPGPQEYDLPQTSKVIRNHTGQACEPGGDTTSLTNALGQSCNTTFAALGEELGGDALAEQAEKFGFGRTFTIPFETVASRVPDDLEGAELAMSAIGQRDIQASPLQMAMVAAAIANRGEVMEPYLIKARLAPDLSTLDTTRPRSLGRAVPAGVASDITDMMVHVVDRGTGRNGQIPGVRVAGKTGTAQRTGNAALGWFVAFAPADSGTDPKVAVAVVVEGSRTPGETSGNQMAAPIAKDVMEAVLR